MKYWGEMVEIFGKSCSFPLVSAHLSRAVGWVVGLDGGGEGGFGGDNHGFGGPVSGFGEAAFRVGEWTGLGWGDGLDPGGRVVAERLDS